VPLPPIETTPRAGTSLAEDTYRRLLAEIAAARMPGGTIVQERRLAAQLGVSRSPLRDALGRLEGQGLLVRDARGVLAVRVVTLQDFLHALDIRVLVEPAAAALACGVLAASELDALERELDLLAADADPEADRVWAFDDALHEAVAAASGNPFILRSVTDMRRLTTIFERQLRLRRSAPGVAEHRSLIDALRRGEAEAARAAMTAHLARVREDVLQNY
jgi:DNA-binding GntR family transcriptional regulator